VDEEDIPHRRRHSARFQITTHVSSEVAAALPAEAGGVQAFQQEASDTPFEDEEAALDAQFLQDVEEPHANLPIDSFEYCVNISLGHRYIYVTTPKCGCSTIQLSLQRLELANPNFDRADLEDLHVRKYSPL